MRHHTVVTSLATDENGIRYFRYRRVSPGFPVIGFFPYAGETHCRSRRSSFNFVDDAFYTTVRVLPFDDAVPQAFVDLWNGTRIRRQAWNFIYFEILYVYDMLFNVMLEYVNLGSQQAVEQNLSGIWSAISQECGSREHLRDADHARYVSRQASRAATLDLPGRQQLQRAELQCEFDPGGMVSSEKLKVQEGSESLRGFVSLRRTSHLLGILVNLDQKQEREGER